MRDRNRTGFLSCILPVPRAGRRLHLGDSVSVLIVPCVRFITRHSGFFLSDGITCSLSSSHIHSLNAGGLPYSAKDDGAEGQPHSSLLSEKTRQFLSGRPTFGHDGVVTRLLLRYCETDDITTLLFFTNSYSRTTWLMDLSDSRKLSSLQKHCFCFLTICRRKFVEYF